LVPKIEEKVAFEKLEMEVQLIETEIT